MVADKGQWKRKMVKIKTYIYVAKADLNKACWTVREAGGSVVSARMDGKVAVIEFFLNDKQDKKKVLNTLGVKE